METQTEIGIRMLTEDDSDALRRVAERDSAEVPRGRLLGATVDGRLVAAHSLSTDESIADPFVPTKELLVLLTGRARQLRQDRGEGLLGRLRGRRSRADVAPSAPGAEARPQET